MSKRKQKCSKCGLNAVMEQFNLRFEQCKEGHWNLSEIDTALAMVMKTQGFDFHEFAYKIDELYEKHGSGRDYFEKNVIKKHP